MTTETRPTSRLRHDPLVRGLGWASAILGVPQVVAPADFTRALGVGDAPLNSRRHWLRLLEPRSRGLLRQAWRRMLRDGKPSTLALELPRGNDGALHLRLWMQPLLGPDGRIQRLLGQVQNITEQHQTDALIRWRTELLNLVSALGRIGGCEIDVATRHMQWT